jgi:hypothetical protein
LSWQRTWPAELSANRSTAIGGRLT